MPRATFGEALQAAMRLRGLGDGELAALVSVGRQAIWRYRNEKMLPKLPVARALVRELPELAPFVLQGE